MRTRLFFLRTVRFACAATILTVASSFSESSPPAAQPRQADPFVKKEVGAPPSPAAPATDLCVVLEVYALDQNEAAKVLLENAASQARHDRIRELVEKKKARLDVLIGNVSKSGQRAVVEQIQELRYVNEFLVNGKDSTPCPIAIETRNAGNTLEWEPVLDEGHRTCSVNLNINNVRFNGFAHLPEPQQRPAFPSPQFSDRKLCNSQKLTTGVVQFLGTLSEAPHFDFADAGKSESNGAKSQEVKLAFARIDPIRHISQVREQDRTPGVLEHLLSFYSLDREAARKVLENASKPGGVYAAVQPLALQGEAKLERITVVKSLPGQRASVEEVREVCYLPKIGNAPNEKVPAKKNAKGSDKEESSGRTSDTASFETRNTGLTLEVESVIGTDGMTVDLNLVPQLVREIDNPQAYPANYPRQPLFETRKITTSLCATLGEQAFIGTFNHPGDTGVSEEKDSGRVWLGFVQTKLIRE